MSGKLKIVTGGNKGIGLAVVKRLCQEFDGTVYLTARNVELGTKAVAECEKLGLHPKFHQLDIDDEGSIVAFKEYIQKKYCSTGTGIDVLVNNAGINANTAAESPEMEAEKINRVNFFGTRNVCKELFPLLNKHARIVNVSSMRGFLGPVTDQEPHVTERREELRKKFTDESLTVEALTELVRSFVKLEKLGKHVENGWPHSSYAVSKVAVSALTRIQQRELSEQYPDKDLVINHIHPGYVGTDMTRYKGPLTVEEGSEAIAWLALLPPNVEKPKGDFVWYDKQIVDWVNGPLPGDRV